MKSVKHFLVGLAVFLTSPIWLPLLLLCMVFEGITEMGEKFLNGFNSDRTP